MELLVTQYINKLITKFCSTDVGSWQRMAFSQHTSVLTCAMDSCMQIPFLLPSTLMACLALGAAPQQPSFPLAAQGDACNTGESS